MAKKGRFFYNKIYNTKRNIINAIIIGVSLIGIILCFIFTSKFYGTNPSDIQNDINIKSEVVVEINQKFNDDIFFSKLENVSLDDIKITYPDNYNISNVGKYNVIITINGKNYDSTLVVVDTERPNLVLKDVTINENEYYTANSFVTSCTDNSNKDCNISFYNDAIDQDGNKINYNHYNQSGTYTIKISAKDESNNEIIKDATLTINKKNSTTTVTPPTNKECKYGNGEYDTSKYIVSVSIVDNNCAISLDLYKDSTMTEKVNKLMETETLKIKKDIDALNISGKLTLNRQISAIFNNSGTGLVGYELSITVNVNDNNNSKNVVSYKVNSEGKRVFSNNPYNLEN